MRAGANLVTVLWVSAAAVSFAPAAEAQIAMISASPELCTIVQGQNRCSSTITWSTTPAQPACIWVLPSNQVWACSGTGSGSQSAPWLDVNGTTFQLKLGTQGNPGALIASKLVRGACGGSNVTHSNGFCVAPLYSSDGRDIGVDYHSTGSEFGTTAFLTRYHLSENGIPVRTIVQEQLVATRTNGAEVVSTRIYPVANPAVVDPEPWRHPFPIDSAQYPGHAQLLTNITNYVQDVRDAGLKLYLGFIWSTGGGWGDYAVGTPETTLAGCNCSAADYKQRVKTTISSVLDAAKGIHFVQGTYAGYPVVERVYLDHELKVAVDDSDTFGTPLERPNARWFLGTSGLWLWFWDESRKAGILPTLYFTHGENENKLWEVWRTDTFTELRKHPTMTWIARGIRFLQGNTLPVPERIDFSSYPRPSALNDPTWVHRIFSDYEAVVPPLFGGTPKDFFVAETQSFYDAESQTGSQEQHLLHQKSFAAQFALHPSFRGVTIWSTPNVAPGVDDAAPFDLSGFSDADIVDVLPPNPSFEASSGCSALGGVNPVNYCTEWINPDVSSWSVRQAGPPAPGEYVFAGLKSLALTFGGCAGGSCDHGQGSSCLADPSGFPGVFVMSDVVTGDFGGQWVRVRFRARYDSDDRRGGAALVDVSNGGKSVAKTSFLQTTANGASAYYPSGFMDYVLLGKFSAGSTQMRVRWQNLQTNFCEAGSSTPVPPDDNTTLFVDDLHW